jgi:hypothetical protein
MKKIIMALTFGIIFSACSLPFGKNQKSALDVKSNPVAAVYINDAHVGSTPFYKDDLKPGTYTIKLVVEENPNLSWQTQVDLKPQLLTNITKSFGTSEDVSSHFTLSLEPINNKEQAQISVISLPDSAVVKNDNQPVGFAPVEISSISPGDHQILVGSPGYKQLNIPVRAIAGHRLTVYVKLAKDKEVGLASPSPTPKPATDSAKINAKKTTEDSEKTEDVATKSAKIDIEKPYVTIKTTPTGWLRVRSEPSGLTDNEVAKIDVGKSFPFTKDNQAGWYQIEYEEGELGWISSSYADLVE